MIELEQGQHVGLIGTTGSGKTYFFKAAIMPQCKHLIVVDTEEMQFNALPEIRGDPLKFVRKLPKDKPYRIRWIPPPTAQPEAMEAMSEALIRYGRSIEVYIDELTDFSSAQSMQPWLKSLFRKARKRKITLIWASQRPAGVNKWAFDNSIHKFFFYVQEFDRHGLEKLYPGISSQLSSIKWQSYQSIYIGPSGFPAMQPSA